MRTLNRWTGIAAVVAGMSGCCGTAAYNTPEVETASADNTPAIKNISTDYIEPMADEKYIVDTTNLPSCPQAKVFMHINGYFILCDFNHHFSHGNDYDSLLWGGNYYQDNGSDGLLESIDIEDVYYIKENINPKQNDWYNQILERLGKEAVHKLWEERWKPYGSE